MGAVVTVEIASNDYYVYTTGTVALDDANEFWAARLGAEADAWDPATDAEKNKALVMSSDWIDRAVRLTGEKTASDQPRLLPRDGMTKNGVAVDDGTTPDDFAYACFWLAGMILVSADEAASEGQGSNVKKAKAGSAEVTFFSATQGTSRDHRLPQVAHDYIWEYFAGTYDLAAPEGSGDDTDDDEYVSYSSDDFDIWGAL